MGTLLKTIRLRADDVIFRQGSPSDKMFLIKKGKVALTSSIDITNYRRIPAVSIKKNELLGSPKMGNGYCNKDD